MDSASFLAKLPDEATHSQRAIALLWYYRKTSEYDDRTAAEIAADLEDEGFSKPHVFRLKEALKRSRYTVLSRGGKAHKVNSRYLAELDSQYDKLANTKSVTITDSIVPFDWVADTRTYLEKIVLQINGSYDYGFYDCCAALCRRLMESLIIEVYVSQKRRDEIQSSGAFLGLESLINSICDDGTITLSRNSRKHMLAAKELGDTAAHDRTYITLKQDVDDTKGRYRRIINELLVASSLKK